MIRTLAITALIFAGAAAGAGSKKKMSYDAAKKECLKESPELKSKALQTCISKKRK